MNTAAPAAADETARLASPVATSARVGSDHPPPSEARS